MVAFAISVEFEAPETVVLPPPLLIVSVELELELIVVMSLLPELVVAAEESVELPAVLMSDPVIPSVVLSSPPLALHSPLEHVCKKEIFAIVKVYKNQSSKLAPLLPPAEQVVPSAIFVMYTLPTRTERVRMSWPNRIENCVSD